MSRCTHLPYDVSIVKIICNWVLLVGFGKNYEVHKLNVASTRWEQLI